MKNSPANPGQATVRYSGLTLKITGIVFWGLALTGLLLSFLFYHGLDEKISTEYQATADRAALQLMKHVSESGDISNKALKDSASRIRDKLGVQGISILYAGERIAIGDIGPDMSEFTQSTTLGISADNGEKPDAIVRVYLPNIAKTVLNKRKQMMVLLGLSFIVFGFILQLVLKKIVTNPFLRMVETAKECADGATNLRFDVRRDDEFGFLGGFINKALDYVQHKQEELEKALEKVRESELALHSEKERAEVTLHSIGDAVITTDREGRVEYMNPVAEKMIGIELGEARTHELHRIITFYDEASLEELECPVSKCLASGLPASNNEHALIIRKDGEEISIANTVSPICDNTNTVIGAVLVLHDERKARKLTKQLSYQASHDALTGLYNRREFELYLAEAIESAHESGRNHALCYLDLDQFKIVNDTCGHAAGDELLRQLSGLLQQQIRDTDILARLGGDEFGVLLRDCNLDQAQRATDALWSCIRDFRFSYQGKSFDVGVSIGLVPVNNQNMRLADMMGAADIACYAAKDAGRNRVHIYQSADIDIRKRKNEMHWVSRIREAIEEDRLRLYLQPIIPVIGSNSLPHHFEVLLRMEDKDGEYIPPMAFIPAMERYGMMTNIDRWVIKTVLMDYDKQLMSNTNGIITINISGHSLCEDEFLDFVVGCLDKSEIPPERICFEITETAAIANLMRAARFINILHGTGCLFALDDFGSGLSSFGYLKSLKVDYLKIDGSFVRDMVDDVIDHAMVTAINQIGHVMGIQTIAEYVESEEIMASLRELGVNYAQGYWIDQPRPIEEVLNIPSLSTKPHLATG